jgi:hypothetical protein
VSPLSDEHYLAIHEAIAARRPIRRAARTANRSAMSILAVGAASVPMLAFSFSFENLAVAAVICTIGYMEHRGARDIARGLPSAATYLGWNQVAFIGLISLYCVNRMLEPISLSPQLTSSLSQLGITKDIEGLTGMFNYVFYGLVMVLSITLQGLLAWYYFSRRRYLEAIQQSTPKWIRRLLDELAA